MRLLLLSLILAVPAAYAQHFPPHYAGRPTTCPVGGEKFDAPSLMHYSTYGALPDGEPVGSIEFPILMPECPANGLTIYREFTPDQLAKLGPLLASDAYKALRGTETSYYRAHWLAKALSEQETAAWLLLRAGWEAKKPDPASARARRYGEEFAALVKTLAPPEDALGWVVLRLRAVNALRELGRFDEAEMARAAIVVPPDSDGADDRARKNREYWAEFTKKLAAPIARRDISRTPIDLLGEREAAGRCLSKEFAVKWKRHEPTPLTPFEVEYCASPAMAKPVAEMRKDL